ncbi:MAG: hypothetical protein JO199_01140 [Candidatus Eremiobacteraeota bacterium]|nr:hypothetical protein [Candidatus Eremiobacteraeota bacterium]
MEFSWNWKTSFFKEFAVKAGSFTHREVHKTMRASIPVRQRLSIDVPFGALTVVGSDGPNAEIEIRVLSRGPEQAQGISYTTRDRDGETFVAIDGPLGGAVNLTTVEVDLRMPRSAPLIARCGLGALKAAKVGPIEAHANLGTVDIDEALTTSEVRANLGDVNVRLSPLWHGDRVAISTNLGRGILRVPSQVRLECKASSSLGKVEIAIGSYEGAPPATIHSNLGMVRIEPAR